MKNSMMQKQKGVGLIEVVITMLVVALGLVAVATFQSDLMSGSGNSKIRSEALALAEQKVEQLRNNIEIGTLADEAVAECTGSNSAIASGYRSICPSVSFDAIGGTNASFTRTWTVSNTAAFIANSPARRKISVEVSWDGNGDGDNLDADERVIVVTEMAWINPADSAAYAAQQGGADSGAVPSPRQDASEDVASENVIGEDMAITDLNTSTTGDAGVDPTLAAAASDPDTGATINITLYQVASGSHFYTATHNSANAVLAQIEEGVIAVFICESGFCTHVQNHFGGVVHSIMGTVYSNSGNGLSDIQVAWSSSEVTACYNATPGTTGSFDTMEYECVFAGNCNATSAGTRTATGTDATDPGCFVDAVVSDAQINARNVGPGGEFGEAGLLGVVDRTGRREQVCFLEDTGLPDDSSNPLLNVGGSVVLNEDYLLPVTKRLYVTRGFNSANANKQNSQGINRSYGNHNFLVVDRKTGGAANEECHNVAVNSLAIASRDIVRLLNVSDANAVLPGTSYPSITGEATTQTGTISGSQTALRMYIPEVGTCFINDNTGGDYVCVAPNGYSPTIFGVSDELPSTAGTFVNCLLATTGTCNWADDF